MFRMLAERYGWTFAEIGELTLGQINVALRPPEELATNTKRMSRSEAAAFRHDRQQRRAECVERLYERLVTNGI